MFWKEHLRHKRSSFLPKRAVSFAVVFFLDVTLRCVTSGKQRLRRRLLSSTTGARHPEPLSPMQTLWDMLCAYLSIFRNCGALTFGLLHSGSYIRALTFGHTGGSVAEWLGRRIWNPLVAGSNPVLTASWCCSRKPRVQLLGYACK